MFACLGFYAVWLFSTDVSEERIGPNFNGQAIQTESFLDYTSSLDGTEGFYRNVGTIPFYAA